MEIGNDPVKLRIVQLCNLIENQKRIYENRIKPWMDELEQILKEAAPPEPCKKRKVKPQ
jgi:hypothetical protein